jgi:hypothetical protein
MQCFSTASRSEFFTPWIIHCSWNACGTDGKGERSRKFFDVCWDKDDTSFILGLRKSCQLFLATLSRAPTNKCWHFDNFNIWKMAVVINHVVAGLPPAPLKQLQPHEKLSHSASLASEFLMHNRPRTHRQYAAFSWANHHNPGLLQNAGNLTYRPRQPKTLRRPMNSWMAFRCMYK